jgi:hypothetical protein
MFATRKTHVRVAGALALFVAAVVHGADDADQTLATLSDTTGEVLLDNGGDFTAATTGISLTHGDRLFVLEDGRATLAFNDGCTAELVGPALHLLTTDTTCEELSGAASSALDQLAADAAASPQAQRLQQAATSQLDERTIGLGIMGAFALGGVIWAATDDDDDNPRPPAAVAPPPISP